MSDYATSTDEISGSDNSSDHDSVDYPESDIDDIVLSDESLTDDSLYTDEFSPAFSWRQSEDSNDSDDADDTSSDNEASMEPTSGDVSPELESPVPEPEETAPEDVPPEIPETVPSENVPPVVHEEEVPSESGPPEAGSGEEVPTEPPLPNEVPLVAEAPVPSLIEPVAQQTESDVIPSPKRRRVVSPDKKKKESPNESIEEEDCCSICFDSWTTSGNHRPAALKCGHLFGYVCIDKWLKGRGEKCPQCNAKAKRIDIRIIFTRNIKAVDTTERDQARDQLAQVQKRNQELMMETAHLGLKYQVVMAECNRLQTELIKAKEEILVLKCKYSNNATASSSQFPNTQDIEGIEGNGNVPNQPPEKGRFVLDKTLTIHEGGNCRVMTHSPFLGTIVVSQPSSVSLFPGFGIKKISSLDFKTTEYLTLHSKAIRNLCFHPTHQDGVLLSCSLDKTVKLTSLISNTTVQSYHLPIGAWSCVWNSDDYNYFYVGLQNGLVQEYDVRNTNACVRELYHESSCSPVVSLQYIPACPNATFRPGGLLVGQLNKVSFYEKIPGNEFKTHLLPLDGNVSNLCFEPRTRQLLASFRSSRNQPKVRHVICELGMIDDTVCGCNIIQTFYGGTTQTLLSRSLLIPHPEYNDHVLVCAGDEASRGVKIWNGNSFRLSQNVPCENNVVDLCYINISHPYLLALSDKRLKFHEWKQ